MRGAPNRRPKAAISPAPRCWLRKTSTGCSAKAAWIHAKVASSSGFERSTPRASVPSASPSGRSSGVVMDDPPSLVYSSVYAGSGYASNRTYQRSEEHTSELHSHLNLVCRLLLEKKKKKKSQTFATKTNKKNTNTTNT